MGDAAEVKILLVEDNADDAELTMRALEKANLGNGIVWLKNGALALDFLFGRGACAGRSTEGRPRLVLLDLKLPKVSGLEVLQRIRADARTANLPVVILSSSTQDRDILSSYDLGVNSYVDKPVQFEQFAKVVTQLGLYWLLINKAPQ
jgi:CheY-like chemotaxis protein